MEFETLGLNNELLRGIEKLGFDQPTPIQEKVIPLLLANDTDLVGLAQTGTGKTGAFGLPLIHRIDLNRRVTQGIILCPTRELCVQITSDLKDFGVGLPNLNIAAVYGGAAILPQMRQLKVGAHIVVATPGRLLDLMNRGVLDTAGIRQVVLDEADEMLNMGFQDDIERIFAGLPVKRHIWLFSATMPPAVSAVARKYMTQPVEIQAPRTSVTPTCMTHTCYMVQPKNRYLGLRRLIDFSPAMFALIFCKTRRDTQELAEKLMTDGYPADALHGDLSQSQRDYVMQRFRKGAVRILVATDVAARGLDVDNISHVIHFTLPEQTTTYTHRSGRTARAGKSGHVAAFITPREMHRIREIERHLKVRFELGKIPNGPAICQKQVLGLVDKIFQAEVDHDAIAAYLPAVNQALVDLDKDELVQRLVAAEYRRYIETYRHAPDMEQDINQDSRSVGRTDSRPDTRSDSRSDSRPHYNRAGSRDVKIGYKPKAAASRVGETRSSNYKGGDSKGGDYRAPAPKKQGRLQEMDTLGFFINIGRHDRINEGAIVRLICERSGIRSSKIGAINLQRDFSFFEVEKSSAARVRAALTDAVLDGRSILVHAAADSDKHSRKGYRPGRAA